MGNQSLYNTLYGYSKHGYEIHLLTCSNRRLGPTRLPESIIVHRHPLPGLKLWHLIKIIRKFLLGSIIKKSIATKKNTLQTDINYKQYRVLHIALVCYVWMSLWSLLLSIYYHFDIYYGYEIFGVPVAWFWGRLFHRPVISRFQGTLMSKYLPTPYKLRYNWTHWLPMRLPVDLVIMTDDGTQGNRVLNYLGVPKNRYMFWRNGVHFKQDLYFNFNNIAFRNEKKIDIDMPLFTSASRMVYWKRIDRIIRAVALVPTDRKFTLVLIGDGDQRMCMELLAQSLGVSDRIKFTGPLSHDEVIKWHMAADVLLSTYDVSNIGNQLLEAQILGKAYITVDTGDTSTLLKHKFNGLLIKNPDDYSAIAKAITLLIDKPNLRKQLSLGAIATGKKQVLSWQARMDKEINVVKACLALKGQKKAKKT